MEHVTFRCSCCRQILPRNPRVKNQQYCGAAECQKARKAKWQREKMNTDSDYRADQRESQRLWQQNNPDYWREYRRNHQEYREHNRQMQRVRDGTYKQPKAYDEIDLAKMDTLNRILNATTETYFISPGPDNLVKMDALQVKIIPFTPG